MKLYSFLAHYSKEQWYPDAEPAWMTGAILAEDKADAKQKIREYLIDEELTLINDEIEVFGAHENGVAIFDWE